MARRRANGQRGFVITLELILIFTILGIGLLVGLVAIRNALFVWWQKKKAQTVYVFDSSDPIKALGPVRDFDEHEAPRLFFIDRSLSGENPDAPSPGVDPAWAGRNFRAFVGVRDDRFTTRHRIFYETFDCTGTVRCIQGAGSEGPDTRLVGQVVNEPVPGSPVPSDEWVDNAGGVGYLYLLQQGPSYGIGSHPDDLAYPTGYPGGLFRQTPDPCETSLNSVWESQRVGDACISRTVTNLSGLFVAEPVTLFNDVDFTPPFRVNLPPDTSSFVTTAPGGFEGAPAGAVTGTYDPEISFDFNVPASGGESGPP